ncbi:hypothetical protein LMG31884_03860 [Xanthomonas hydrangeae]|nr:hypothetical protein LMG31884_03860 [Xanthomonas hydrangeae]CAD7713006.1 hypothetical protein LMG31884_03860 [Xanthomonas hydrangeae]CAD7718589.1 hypothetical protein LMG31887_03870 [Xanthomonas hydrangeae]CAD7718591.1 hypothetical protein LMG31887_03870 [Xanthomonas hydrangeae]
MPKYETAWYLNDQKHWEEVSFRELARDERRAGLRERDLRDERDGIFELGIRNHPKTPHFFELRRIRTDLEPAVKESEAHEEQKRMVRAFLSKYEKHDMGYYERPWNKDKGFESLLKLKYEYQWGTEVQFGLVYGKFVRFDIFGRSKDEIQLTDRCPLVAIEIVDTHFHSREAFKVLLETSRNIPLVVAYYFIPVAPRLNCVKKPERSNGYSRIRLQCYIADGSFWFRNERVEEMAGVAPESPDVYYNFIREKLCADGYIRPSN